MLLPNRHGSTDDYRYGFNGMEKDDEVKGEGNSYDFGARMLDPRVGRWFAIDNEFRRLPMLSPYNFVKNNPLRYIDPDGNFNIDVHRRITRGSFSSMNTIESDEAKSNIQDYRMVLMGTPTNMAGSVIAPDVRYIKSVLSFGVFGEDSDDKEHFDGMNYNEILTNFDRVNKGINKILKKFDKGNATISELGGVVGESLHAVQDFYSHSNFIELYLDVYGETELSEIPTLQEAMSSKDHEKFAAILKDKLKTGDTSHDGEGSHTKMNHDIGKSTVWREATPGTKGKVATWNSRAAEAVAKKATKVLNDQIESKIITKTDSGEDIKQEPED